MRKSSMFVLGLVSVVAVGVVAFFSLEHQRREASIQLDTRSTGDAIGARGLATAATPQSPSAALVAPAMVEDFAPIGIQAEPVDHPPLSPAAAQFRALVKRYEDATTAWRKRGESIKSEAERKQMYDDWPAQWKFSPDFYRLAEAFPNDPVAVDALCWVIEHGTLDRPWASGVPDGPAVLAGAWDRLLRDHLADDRLGRACLLHVFPSGLPVFKSERRLREILRGSPNRNVRGQATLALSRHLINKAGAAEYVRAQHTDAERAKLEEVYGKDELTELATIDLKALRQEADDLFGTVRQQYGDVPYVRPDGRPTRETLADAVTQSRASGPQSPAAQQLSDLFESYKKADLEYSLASAAASTVKQQQAAVKHHPRWGDFGPSFLNLAEAYPRSPEALDAVLWLFEKDPWFLDSPEERAVAAVKVAEILIREHLSDSRVIWKCLQVRGRPSLAFDRVLPALCERGSDRTVKGRASLALGRYLMMKSDVAEGMRNVPEAYGFELGSMYARDYINEIRNLDLDALRGSAKQVLEKVIAQYADVPNLAEYMNAPGSSTLGKLAAKELAELDSLRVGMVAPEIDGQDIDGHPMKLNEYRGKVVVLSFGSHEYCSACRNAYPAERAVVARYRGQPFALLGVNHDEHRDRVRAAIASGEITWRCWWDGINEEHGICERWNIAGFPTVYVLDHRGVIRYKDVSAGDQAAFDLAISRLLKEADEAR
jgi:peroxiredoxin